MDDDLIERGKKTLSEAEEIKAQVGKLLSLVKSGKVAASTGEEIKREYKSRAESVLTASSDLLAKIGERLDELSWKKKEKEKEKEVIEAKHMIGALSENEYKAQRAKVEVPLKQIWKRRLD